MAEQQPESGMEIHRGYIVQKGNDKPEDYYIKGKGWQLK